MSTVKRILFVCQGNIIRSPLAEALFRTQSKQADLGAEFQIDSAGTIAYHVGEGPDSRMLRTAAARGLQYAHRARQIKEDDLERYDLIIVMDAENYADLLNFRNARQHQQKIRFLREFDPTASTNAGVPDPYYGGPDGFEHTFDVVERSVRGLIDALARGDV